MTKKTHQSGGMLVSIVGFALLKEQGLLLPDVHEGLQWLVMYPFCMWGSTASDLDHHWDSCPSKDYPSKVINLLLHITKPVHKSLDKTLSDGAKKNSIIYKTSKLFNARHRSWQTHSDLTLISMVYVLYMLFSGMISGLGAVDSAICTLVLTGICLGVLAHFILDVLTPEGIWLIGLVWLNKLLQLFNPRVNIPQKLHLVPRTEFFATGGKWEEFVQKVLKFSTYVALLWFLYTIFEPQISVLIPYTLEFK